MTLGVKVILGRNVTLVALVASSDRSAGTVYGEGMEIPNVFSRGQSHEQGGSVGEDLQIHRLQWLKRGHNTEHPKPKLNPKWA